MIQIVTPSLRPRIEGDMSRSPFSARAHFRLPNWSLVTRRPRWSLQPFSPSLSRTQMVGRMTASRQNGRIFRPGSQFCAAAPSAHCISSTSCYLRRRRRFFARAPFRQIETAPRARAQGQLPTQQGGRARSGEALQFYTDGFELEIKTRPIRNHCRRPRRLFCVDNAIRAAVTFRPSPSSSA